LPNGGVPKVLTWVKRENSLRGRGCLEGEALKAVSHRLIGQGKNNDGGSSRKKKKTEVRKRKNSTKGGARAKSKV